MDVIISLGDPIELTVTAIHPVALPDAIELVLNAAIRLQRELTRATDAE